jgi:hypothetical protein
MLPWPDTGDYCAAHNVTYDHRVFDPGANLRALGFPLSFSRDTPLASPDRPARGRHPSITGSAQRGGAPSIRATPVPVPFPCADAHSWCPVPGGGADALLFGALAVFAGALLYSKLSAVWALLAGKAGCQRKHKSAQQRLGQRSHMLWSRTTPVAAPLFVGLLSRTASHSCISLSPLHGHHSDA